MMVIACSLIFMLTRELPPTFAHVPMEVLPDDYSRLLFRMSSIFPPHLLAIAKGIGVCTEIRAFFGYRQGHEAVVDFFEIGMRATQMR